MAETGYLLLSLAFFIFSSAKAVDLDESILESGRNGTDVVLLSVAYIEQAAIFPDSNQLLRRIAYVETHDGSDPEAFNEGNSGGIWAVRQDAFTRTQIGNDSNLIQKREQIMVNFGINWEVVHWSELNKPFYSALAARLVLLIVTQSIPTDTDLTAQAQFWRENYKSDGSVADFINAAQGLGGKVAGSSAYEFFIGYPRGYSIVSAKALQKLFITTSESDPVPFTVDTLLGFEFSGVATRDYTTVISFGNSYQVFNSSDRRKGIQISAGNRQIDVYGINYENTSSDAFLALPCSGQNLDEYVYYGTTYDDESERPSQLLFVGCEDNTKINIGSKTIFLNKMETYLHEVNSDITGTRAVSNKAISFFSGHQCTNIPTRGSLCDQLIEQLPNTATWGSHFLTSSLASRSTGDIYRILASQPSTSVTFTCSTLPQPSTYTLSSAGSWKEITLSSNSYCAIESNNPVLVVQFSLSHSLDQVGDPFMMMLPPIGQYINNYNFITLPEFKKNFITIFVAPKHYQPDKIFMDGSSQEEADWTTIYCADSTVCGYTAYISLTAGDHRLYHRDISATIGVSVYGFNATTSYGYPGGLQAVPMQGPVATVSFSQASYSVRDDEGTLTVTVERFSDPESYIVVLIATHPTDGTATAEEDFSLLIKLLEFKSSDIYIDANIKIFHDKFTKKNKTFVVYLTSGVGVQLSPYAQTEVTIITTNGNDDDDGNRGGMNFTTEVTMKNMTNGDDDDGNNADDGSSFSNNGFIITSIITTTSLILVIAIVVSVNVIMCWKKREKRVTANLNENIYATPGFVRESGSKRTGQSRKHDGQTAEMQANVAYGVYKV